MEKNKYLKIWIFSVIFLLGLCFIGKGTEKGTSAANPAWEVACPQGYQLDINTCYKEDKNINLKSVCDAQGENWECMGPITGENDTSCTACRHTISAHYKIEVILMDGDEEYTTLPCETADLDDMDCPIDLPDISKSGHKFLGWSNEEACTSTPFYKNLTSIHRNSENGILYACWESLSSSKNCYVTEEGRYVSLTPEEAEEDYVTEEGGTYTKVHDGECTGNESGSTNKTCFKCTVSNTTKYQTNMPTDTCASGWQETQESDCDKTYYAQFKDTATSYTKTTSCTIKANELDTKTSCDADLPSENPQQEGKTFIGWTETANSCSNPKTTGKISVGKNGKTLYACWETSVKVTFNPTSEGTISGMTKGQKKELTCTYKSGEESCNVSENPTATKSGQEFLGWDESAECNAPTKNIKSIEFKEDKTLIACYAEPVAQDKTVTVTYDANGGRITSGSSTETCTIKSGQTSCTIKNFPTAEKEGYTFGGWGYSANCQSGHQIGTSATTTETKTLYACWNKINNDESEPPVEESSNENDNDYDNDNDNDNDYDYDNDNENDDVENNPVTGEITIFIVWIAAFLAIGYSIYYYKEIKEH